MELFGGKVMENYYVLIENETEDLKQTARRDCPVEDWNFCGRYVLPWIFLCMESAGLMLTISPLCVMQEPAVLA